MVGAFVVVCGVITYDEIKNCTELPWPPRYVAAALVFSLLDLVSMFSEGLGAALAVGFVLAMVICTACGPGNCPGCSMTLAHNRGCHERDGVATVNPATMTTGTIA